VTSKGKKVRPQRLPPRWRGPARAEDEVSDTTPASATPGLEGVVPKLHRGGEGRGRWLWLGQRRPGDGARAYPRSEFHGYDSSDLAIRLPKRTAPRRALRMSSFTEPPQVRSNPTGRMISFSPLNSFYEVRP
jgi:hypothetical protein